LIQILSLSNATPGIQDGGKIQNGAQTLKEQNFVFSAKFSADLKKNMRFICRSSIYKKPLSLIQNNPKCRGKSN
jgi:hypothetical protein